MLTDLTLPDDNPLYIINSSYHNQIQMYWVQLLLL